jgi:hypothetical protein
MSPVVVYEMTGEMIGYFPRVVIPGPDRAAVYNRWIH